MPMVLFPTGKIVHICDDVVADPVSHKPSLLNLWEVIRLPPNASTPYTLGKLCLVALMSDGVGEARFHVQVVRADDLETVRRSQDYMVNFSDRQRSKLVVIKLKDATFPEPGTFLVELYCGGVFVDDRPITVLAP